VVMSARRRGELADWARTVDGWVVEDDYDAEFRFDRHPVGALQGVLPDRVIYHGTLSKSLAPGLRLGWLVVPPDLLDDVLAARFATDHMTASLIQGTFAVFLERGDLDRHLRRSRRVYRERRDALVAALDRELPEVRVEGVSAGLNAFVTLPPGWDSAEVAAAARRRGTGVYPLADELADPELRRRSLVLGYGMFHPDRIEEGICTLAAAVAERTPV
jgi:GntR family transcriptional regulator / MocR family aminotransferase